jgi:MFS superfamily sulfate permease-like transporter
MIPSSNKYMTIKTPILSNVKGDFAAGLVVFLIAVPLCLGIALASGAPLFSGIVSGIIGGIVVGFMSGSQLSVSGPAAGLTAIVLAGITDLGAFDIFLCAVVIAGLIQLALGFLKAGSVSNYFPSNVIEGMLTAIGIIIILKQIPHAFGYDVEAEGVFAFKDIGGNTFSRIATSLNFIQPAAVIITMASLFILILWQKVPALAKLKALPGALVAVLAGIAINELLTTSGSAWALNQSHLVTLPVAGNVQEFLGQFITPNFAGFLRPDVWMVGGTIAIVASIETLLCIEATDKLDPLKRYSSTNQELKAQGVGNLLSGLVGGIPMTSVIVRSSANINAGGRTKLSTIIHGSLLLFCVALIPVLLNKIPLATLAAILLMTGYKLAKPSVFVHMWNNGKYQFMPFIVTVVAVVATDLLKGVILGLVVSVFAILRGNLKSPYFFKRKEYKTGDVIHIHLSQEVSFLNKAAIKMTLEQMPANSHVIIDAGNSMYIDFDVLQIIQEFKNVKAPNSGIRVDLTGFKDAYNIENTVESYIELEEEHNSTINKDELRTHAEFKPLK